MCVKAEGLRMNSLRIVYRWNLCLPLFIVAFVTLAGCGDNGDSSEASANKGLHSATIAYVRMADSLAHGDGTDKVHRSSGLGGDDSFDTNGQPVKSLRTEHAAATAEVSSSPGDHEEEADSFMGIRNQAFTYLRDGHLDAALKAFTQAIELEPNDAESRYGRGVAFLENGFPDTAIQDFRIAIAWGYDSADIYCQRGLAYAQMGVFLLAIADCTRAIRRDPGLADAYFYRGLSYLGDRKFDRAIVDLSHTILLAPEQTEEVHEKLAECYILRGLRYFDQRLYAQAAEDFTSAIHLAPDNPVAYYNRSLVYKKVNAKVEAADDLVAARKLGLDLRWATVAQPEIRLEPKGILRSLWLRTALSKSTQIGSMD